MYDDSKQEDYAEHEDGSYFEIYNNELDRIKQMYEAQQLEKLHNRQAGKVKQNQQN